MTSVPKIRTKVVLRSEQSDGAVSMIDNIVPPRTQGPPLHRHDFDEAFYMVDGELTFQVEDELVVAKAGDLAFAPRNVAHTFSNRSHEPAHYVLVCTPAGFERYFGRIAAEQAGEEPPEWAQQPTPEVERVGPQIELD